MSATLNWLLAPLQTFWDEGVEEICINAPGEAWIWTKGGFQRREVQMTAEDIEDLAHVAAAQWRRDVGPTKPLLSCDLPGEGRLQVVLPPCVAPGYPSLTIRIGDDEWPTLEEYEQSGFFAKTRNTRRPASPVDDELAALYRVGDWRAFFELAVRAKKTIVGCGQTASGKTRFSKALVNAIPLTERMITIEDAPELRKLPHPNRVQLFYDKEANGKDDGRGPTAVQLVEAALRMRIGRLFLQEIRDGQAMLAFLTALMTGHPGAVTTVHASSPEDTFDRLRGMLRGTDAGRALEDEDINKSLYRNIDVVMHFDRWGQEFSMSEVWFAPVSMGAPA